MTSSLDLLLGAEDVRVVLDEVADAQQAVQRAARLVAVHEAGLGVADRQVAVGVALVVVERAVRRAVHGLEAHRLVLGLRDVHVLAVLVPVAGDLPQLDVVEDRRLDLAVAARGVLSREQRGERVADRRAGGCQNARARARARRRGTGPSSRPSLRWSRARACSSRSRWRGEVLLGVEGRAVDAGEHLAVGVAAPVGARDATAA